MGLFYKSILEKVARFMDEQTLILPEDCVPCNICDYTARIASKATNGRLEVVTGHIKAPNGKSYRHTWNFDTTEPHNLFYVSLDAHRINRALPKIYVERVERKPLPTSILRSLESGDMTQDIARVDLVVNPAVELLMREYANIHLF